MLTLTVLASALPLLLTAQGAALQKKDLVDPGPLPYTQPLTGASLPDEPGFPDFQGPAIYDGKFQKAIYLSIDGFHATDLEYYVKTFPSSTMATLLKTAIKYTNARCSAPSDSMPGTMALATGSSPRTNGAYYDDAYDRALYPPGSNCTGPIGTPTTWDETVELNDTIITGGGGFNVSLLPLTKTAWGTCVPVYPWNFLRVNTVFEVIRQAGYVTAYTDKHPVYSMVNGPSGLGLTEGFFPEIQPFSGSQQTTEGYDDLHWSALQNWTQGLYANGTAGLGVPKIMGSNFQAVSVSQKAATGGYNSDLTPSTNLTQAMRQVDTRLGQLVATMKAAGTYDETLLIVTAKHGQSPRNRTMINKIPGATLLDIVGVPTVQDASDDGSYIWLKNQGDAARAKMNLLANKTAAGVAEVWIGQEIVGRGFGNPAMDSRTPDVIVKSIPGTIYTTGSKIAEHGGLNADDLDVAMFVSNPNIAPSTCDTIVSIRQVPVTILASLGFNAGDLQGASLEGVTPLPGVPVV